jgi:epoxyqueuosine reductase
VSNGAPFRRRPESPSIRVNDQYSDMPEALTVELMALSEAHGVSAFGVTGIDPFHRERMKLRTEKDTGRSGPLRFTYDDPDQATDLTRSFPWSQRLVVIGWDYLADSGTPAAEGAVVGRFATSNHYEAVRGIASELAARLREYGYRAELLIDDNRLVDRAAAARAGVGWVGKSTMLLAPGHGPWMLLGSVVTDALLTIGAPMQRGCGTCVACFPACPTGAITDNGLDARRCLSTWLQAPASIPQWIRPLLGRRIYGCDDCLTACPPGQRALKATGEKPLDLAFQALLALSDEELLERFSWWYIPRRQGRFIRRNLLVAAGNSAELEAQDSIVTHLAHPSSMIRGHAAWAMARGFPGIAGPVLREALSMETVPEARDELALALLMVEHPEAHKAVLAADEWVGNDETMRALAVTGSHASGEGGINSDLELLVIHSGARRLTTPELPGTVELVHVNDDPGAYERPMMRVYDPDSRLQDLRRRARVAATAANFPAYSSSAAVSLPP